MVLPLLFMNPIFVIGILAIGGAAILIMTLGVLGNPVYFFSALLVVGILGYAAIRHYMDVLKQQRSHRH